MARILTETALCLLLALFAYALIYAGLAFLNKRFLSLYLDGFYAQTSMAARLGIFLVCVALPANYLLAKTFIVSNASIASVCILVAIVIVTVVNAVLLDHVRVTAGILMATFLAMASCGWLAWLLVKNTPS